MCNQSNQLVLFIGHDKMSPFLGPYLEAYSALDAAESKSAGIASATENVRLTELADATLCLWSGEFVLSSG